MKTYFLNTYPRHILGMLSGLMVVCSVEAKAKKGALPQPQVSIRSKEQEALDRSVDRVALQAQERAIAGLASLLKRYRGTAKESTLLARLGEAHQQEAAIRFRVAHGAAHRGHQKLDLSRYKKSLQASIQSYTELVQKFPTYPDLHDVLYLRAKAYDDSENRVAAKRDYLDLVTRFPQAHQATSAHMRLAEFAVEAESYPEAVRHLVEVEKKPQDPQYPFALYQLAWAHYNLGQLEDGLGYLERHVTFYKSRPEKMQSSDAAILENSYMDMALFRYEGFEKRRGSRFESISKTLEYFHEQKPEEFLGAMNLRYARLLRAGGFEKALDEWKDLLIHRESKLPETLEVILVSFENRVNQHEYLKLSRDLDDLNQIRSSIDIKVENASLEKVQTQLSQTLEELQGVLLKNKQATRVADLSTLYEKMVDTYTILLPERDTRRAKAHFNAAETLFQLTQYEKAVGHYRWIVEREEKFEKSDVFDPMDSALRAIAARYEFLKGQGVIPRDLQARARPVKESAQVSSLLKEWISWIDAVPAAQRHVHRENFENYAFEANRSLYAAGDFGAALPRLRRFAEESSESSFAIPSATLVLDTELLSQSWEQAYALILELRRIKAWKNDAFATRLKDLEADTFYKKTEKRGEKESVAWVADAAEECLEKYSESPRAADCRLLRAQSFLKLGKSEKSERMLTELLNKNGDSSAARVALWTRAQLRDEQYSLKEAAQDYREIWAQGDSKARERALLYTWLQADEATLSGLLKRDPACVSGEFSREGKAQGPEWCQRYASLLWQKSPGIAETLGDKKRVDLKTDSALQATERVVRALNVLKWKTEISTIEREHALLEVSKSWNQVDALVQFQVLGSFPELLGENLESLRAELKSKPGTLKAQKRSISRRLEKVAQFEKIATQVMKLPWARIRVMTLDKVAQAYLDLAVDIREIPAPKDWNPEELQAYQQTLVDLLLPFEEKGQDLRRKALEAALEHRVEFAVAEKIFTQFAKDNPSQSKAFESRVDHLKKLSLPPYLETAEKTPEDKVLLARREALAKVWEPALHQKNYPLAAWALGEWKRIGKIPEARSVALKAELLERMGFRSEAWALRGVSEQGSATATHLAEVRR